MTIRCEFSGAELIEPDYVLSNYPMGVLVKMMMKANEVGLQGNKIRVVEIMENFSTQNRYVDFIIDSN